MDERERRQMMKETFDTVSPGYDNAALRFFAESARHLAGYLDGLGSGRVLDAATGTGNVAMEIARRYPGLHVTGIDLSPGMLAQARAKAAAEGLLNVDLLEMDMHALTFPDYYFDAVVCAFGIFFADDMAEQLRHLASKVRPGGRIATTCFAEETFSPLMDIFGARLEQYGIERPPLKWKLIATEERCSALFRESGLQDIRVERRDHGYHLSDAVQWWDLIWNAGLRSQLSRLSAEDLPRFRAEHLGEIDALRTVQGIRLHVEVLYSVADRPSR